MENPLLVRDLSPFYRRCEVAVLKIRYVNPAPLNKERAVAAAIKTMSIFFSGFHEEDSLDFCGGSGYCCGKGN